MHSSRHPTPLDKDNTRKLILKKTSIIITRFKNNDIWQHFRAVEEDNVYYLDSKLFSMSANFDYPEALDVLQPILYGEE